VLSERVASAQLSVNRLGSGLIGDRRERSQRSRVKSRPRYQGNRVKAGFVGHHGPRLSRSVSAHRLLTLPRDRAQADLIA